MSARPARREGKRTVSQSTLGITDGDAMVACAPSGERLSFRAAGQHEIHGWAWRQAQRSRP
jgi:hypothetical protein